MTKIAPNRRKGATSSLRRICSKLGLPHPKPKATEKQRP